jgi:hypothetical protein
MDDSWRSQAFCRLLVARGEAELSWWFPADRPDGRVRPGAYDEARRICSLCPVQVACLESALAEGDVDAGMRAGWTPAERRRLRQERQKQTA